MESLIAGVLSVFISLRNLDIGIFLQELRDLHCKKYLYLNKTQINGSLKFLQIPKYYETK